jgi:hypothetical protein
MRAVDAEIVARSVRKRSSRQHFFAEPSRRDFLTNLTAANKLLRMVEALPRSQSAISCIPTSVRRAKSSRAITRRGLR